MFAVCCSVVQYVAACCNLTYASNVRVQIRMHRIHPYIYITKIYGMTAAYLIGKHKKFIHMSIHIDILRVY